MRNFVKTIVIGGVAGLALAGCSQENNTVEPEATETAVAPLPMPTETVAPDPMATDTMAPDATAPDAMATDTATPTP
jgi:hypothetical protein